MTSLQELHAEIVEMLGQNVSIRIYESCSGKSHQWWGFVAWKGKDGRPRQLQVTDRTDRAEFKSAMADQYHQETAIPAWDPIEMGA